MKKNLFLILLAVIVLIFISRNKKIEREKSKNKRLFNLNEKLVYAWEIKYSKKINSYHLKVEVENNDREEVYLILNPSSSNSIKKPKLKEKIPFDHFLANVKNINTIDFVKIIDEKNSNNIKKWSGEHQGENWYRFYWLDSQGKKQITTLYKGMPSLAPEGYYVWSDKHNKIFTIEKWAIDALEQKPESLRDPNFLQIEPEEITQINLIEIKDKASTNKANSLKGLSIKKDNYYWILKTNRGNWINRDQLNIKEIDYLVQNIAYLRAIQVYDLNTSDKIIDKINAEMELSRTWRVFYSKKNKDKTLQRKNIIFKVLLLREDCYVLKDKIIYQIEKSNWEKWENSLNHLFKNEPQNASR